MTDGLHDEDIEKETDPELDHGDIDDLVESVGDTLEGQRTAAFLDDELGEHPGDMGASGDVGLEELALSERLEEEEQTSRERQRLPSDLQSPGDPNAGDVGISGGIASGEDVASNHIEGADMDSEEDISFD